MLGFGPLLAFLVLGLFFPRVEKKIKRIDICFIYSGLVVWTLGFWMEIVAFGIMFTTGHWPMVTNLAALCYIFTMLAFLEPFLKPRWHH